MALVDLGIDARVAAILAKQGIKELYPPQVEAWQAYQGGNNLLVAIPTASGKSLVAYLAILHEWLKTGRKAIYIVPLRALASEKVEELRQFEELGLSVGVATGDPDEAGGRAQALGRHDIIVCTSEKADAMLRHRTAWVQDVGCVVADEVHLIHDASRGPTLEVILTRFRAVLPDTRIVALSATMQNARDVARWLEADLVTSTWRPVSLRTGTYHGNALQFMGEPARELPHGGDPVASLIEETIRDGGQCLVFVSTRRSAEAQAQRLAGTVRDLLRAEDVAELDALVGEMGGDGGRTMVKLQKLCRAGVAYHTAGLDAAQRRFVEQQFRARKIKVICATPTLAAGVNTPARRVIIRDLRRFEVGYGNRPLPVMEVHQMMGRAGRPGYDPVGEAVLLAKDAEMRDAVVETYLLGETEAITSKLGADAALRIHVLASVAGGYCQDEDGLAEFLGRTFWATESANWLVRDRLDDVMVFLEDHGFLEVTGSGPTARIRTTLFGKRTSDLYIDPLSALRMRKALEARPAGEEPSEFGLLSVIAGCPDIYPLYLRKSDEWVQERFWELEEEFLVQDDLKDLENAMSLTKTALLLRDWVREVPQRDLEEQFQIGPGDVRMRLDVARWLVHAFRELARALRDDWQAPLNDLGMCLEHGVSRELLPLVRLEGIGRVRARTLRDAGIRRPNDLVKFPPAKLAALPGFGETMAKSLLAQVGVTVEAIVPEPPAPEQPEASDTKGQSSLRAFGGQP